MLAKASSFLSSVFQVGGTPSLVLSLDAGNVLSYPGTGATWSDLTIFNNDTFFTTSNNPTYSVSGGGSFQFGDVDEAFILSASANGFPLGDSQYTIETWINPDNLSQTAALVIYGSLQANSANSIGLSNSSIIVDWVDNILSSPTQSMIPGNWYYLSSTYDGTDRKIYLNGSLIASDTPGVTNSVEFGDYFTIGNFMGLSFTGKISIVKLHTKALSGSRLLSNFNSLKTRFGYTLGSMEFNSATSSYLISSSSDYVFGSNDFTIESFFKASMSSGTYGGVISLRGNSTNGVGINLSNTNTNTPNIEFITDDNVYAPSPGPGEILYYIRLIDANNNNTIMFTGFFYVDDSTDIVQRFYDSTNPTVDIRSNSGNGGPTYLYYPGWLCFDGGGCNITSFPYIYGPTEGDYNLYGNVASSTGNYVDGYGNVTYEFSSTPFNSYTASNDVWYHVAISRTGGTSSFFVNGELIKQIADNYYYGNNDLVIGRYYTDINNYYFNGIISNARVINGTGLYTSNFTPPSTPLSATVSNTKLLIVSQQTTPTTDVSGLLQSVTASNIGWTSSLPEFIVSQGLEFFVDATDSISNPSNSLSNWLDISGNGRNITFSGPTFSSFCHPGCANSLSFQSNQTAQTSPVTISYPTGYTIESVVRFTNTSDGDGIFEFDESSSGKYINVQRESNGKIRFEVNQGNQFLSVSSTTNNLWYHITCVYNSSTQLAKIYINGVEDASGTYSSTTSTTAPIILGLHDYYLDGSISLTRFYSIPFTQAQVLLNYNYTKSIYGI